jgi:hypothetical protein
MADLCDLLIERLLRVCETIRTDAGQLGSRSEKRSLGLGWDWSASVERRLTEGNLPFANSDICPVRDGYMEPDRTKPQELVRFAEAHLAAYEELDELGRLANEWARRLAFSARALVGIDPSEALGGSAEASETARSASTGEAHTATGAGQSASQ